jgi:peptidoglycan hydrolase-like protein with peptidoglycan-binding domain
MSIPTEVQEGQMDRAEPSATPPQPSRPPRRLGRRALLVGGLLVVAGGGVVATDAVRDRYRSGTSSATPTAPPATATVRQMRLVSQTRLNGTLGYAGSYEVVNRASGTLTKLPKVGEVLKPGAALYEVEGKQVVLLRGSVPAYRVLSRTMKGADVRQLNAELVAHGYANKSQLDPDSDTFSSATVAAMKKFQKKFGHEQTGNLELGQAVFIAAEEIRITEVAATVGSPADPSAIMKASSTERQVVVALEVARATGVKVGDEVTVTLPDFKTTPAVVTAIDVVAKKNDSGSPTVDVYIKLTKPGDAGALDQAPVQVAVISESVDNVLAVPVNALLALAGGGYAIEVIEADSTRKLYPVETGLFDNSAGMVEITGAGVTAGQTVVVPAA